MSTTLWPFGTHIDASQSKKKEVIKTQIRWLIRRDMPEVLEIERGAFEYAWCEEDFLCALRQRNTIGMVAEYRHQIVGFMVYELHKSQLNLTNFAVDRAFYGRDIDTQLVKKLVDKLSQQRRNKILVNVRETNLPAQLFFRRMGFKAVHILHDHYDDTTEDCYVMRFSTSDFHEKGSLPFEAPYDPEYAAPFNPHNRISEYFNAA